MFTTRSISRSLLGCLVILSLNSVILPNLLSATEKEQPQESKHSNPLVQNPEAETFTYVWEGRSDPFKPFIEPKVATKIDLNEVVDEDKVLTGMQLFEPGQLTLVAVMEAGGKKIAMVEDDTGKGYVIHEGMLIGRNGIVSQINKDNDVIITETERTRAGKEIVSTIVMRLNKEGD